MQLNRCPNCRSRLSIEQMVQDKNGSDLLGLFMDLPEGVGRVLTHYIALFKSNKRDLPLDRALRLATQVLTLSDDKRALATAMEETLQAMRLKQEDGTFKQLTNHNYLKRVLETVTVTPNNAPLNTYRTPVKQSLNSKTGQAMVALEEFKRGE